MDAAASDNEAAAWKSARMRFRIGLMILKTLSGRYFQSFVSSGRASRNVPFVTSARTQNGVRGV